MICQGIIHKSFGRTIRPSLHILPAAAAKRGASILDLKGGIKPDWLHLLTHPNPKYLWEFMACRCLTPVTKLFPQRPYPPGLPPVPPTPQPPLSPLAPPPKPPTHPLTSRGMANPQSFKGCAPI